MNGVLILSAPSFNSPNNVERYPSLKSFNVIKSESGKYLVDFETKLGQIYIDDSPVFHGGPGRVLEQRLISHSELQETLIEIGFKVSQIQFDIGDLYGANCKHR